MTRALLVSLLLALGTVGVVAHTEDTELGFRLIPQVPFVRVTGLTGMTTVEVSNTAGITSQVVSIEHGAGCGDVVLSPPSALPVSIPAGMSMTFSMTCPATVPLGLNRCPVTLSDAPPGMPSSMSGQLLGLCERVGVSNLSAAPTTHDFGTVAVGTTSAPQTFTITNVGPTGVDTLQLQLTDLTSTFLIGAPCNMNQHGCDVSGVGPAGSGGTTTVQVMCKPIRTGVTTASLYVSSRQGIYLSAPIQLTCTGEAAAEPVLSVSPPVADAGAVEVTGGTANRTVTLSNSGSGTLQITSLQIADAGVPGTAADWSYTLSGKCTSTPCSLSGPDVLSVQLTFDPSTFGTRPATLLVEYVDTQVHAQTVPLQGVGIGATLTLVGAQTAFDFGVVPLDMTSSALVFQLQNTGNRPTSTATLTQQPAPVPAFTLPSGPLFVPPGITPVSVTCRSSVPGVFQTTVLVAASDVSSQPFELTFRCDVRDTALYANPAALQLGEIRTGTTPPGRTIQLLSVGPPVGIASAVLDPGDHPLLNVVGPTSPQTPSTLGLEVMPTQDGSLDSTIIVTATNGGIEPFEIPITGSVVTASYETPPPVSLGTFCIHLPTSPSTVALRSTGTATIELEAPALAQGGASPFDLAELAPSTYPATLAPLEQAAVQITPKRRDTTAIVSDEIVWRTDVATAPVTHTMVSAEFIDEGAAVSPPMVNFGRVKVHLETMNTATITIQNCESTLLRLRPAVMVPFALQGFPTMLMPNETATFGVSFRPVRVDVYEQDLVITSETLPGLELRIALRGEGITDGEPEPEPPIDPDLRTSFYACGGCASHVPADAAGAALLALGVAAALSRRRRSGSSSAR